MILSDLPPTEQQQFLDGITVGLHLRERGQPGQLAMLDPWRGSDAGWWWRKGLTVGMQGHDALTVLAALPGA